MMAKKAGILTLYHKTYNYGAQLQAYALQKVIERLGYECEQISFQWGSYQIEKYYQGMTGNRMQFQSFSESIPHSRRVYTPADIHECVNDYDIFICGSDQIWGVNESMPKFVLPQITLSFVPEDKVTIAYGASMGSAAVSDTIKACIKNPVSKLDAVSVREQSAIPFVSEMTTREVVPVLDPTMLLHTKDWDEIAVLPEAQNYILIYNIGENSLVSNAASILAAKLQCKIITLSYSEHDAAGPREFIGLIKNAGFVLTNSFHGTVFSILYQKQFLTFPVDQANPPYSKSARMTDLLSTFGLCSRMIYDSSELEAALTDTCLYENVGTALAARRASSLEFLNKSMEIVKAKAQSVVAKQLCYGCGACVAACPSTCIEMISDTFGFPYPQINTAACSGCGKCKKICPAQNPVAEPETKKPTVYAAFHKDEAVRKSASSGGVAPAFAQEIINRGGAVFGAAYDEKLSVRHLFAKTIGETEKFKGSKYIQSHTGRTYQEAEALLKQGVPVLYIGTPCQVEGLKAYLQRDYDNLFTIDFVCNGVGGPMLLQKYLKHENQTSDSRVIDFKFRDKSIAWRHPPMTKLIYENGSAKITSMSDNLCFGLYTDLLRESCYHCGVKKANRESDITLCDFWGVKDFKPHLDDGKGLSVVFIQSQKGKALFESVSEVLYSESLSTSYIARQRLMTHSDMPSCSRDYLMSIFSDSTVERLYYEKKLIEKDLLYDSLWRNLDKEIKRTELLGKLTKLQMLGGSLDFDPDMKGKVLLYGAGKVGKLACELFDSKLLGLIDGFAEMDACKGYPVFRLESGSLKSIIKENGEVTVLVTVPWDMDKISAGIKDMYPEITNIVSIEKVVEKIWL